MRAYVMYVLALLALGIAVRALVDEARKEAYKEIDQIERDAWSSGFERGSQAAK